MAEEAKPRETWAGSPPTEEEIKSAQLESEKSEVFARLAIALVEAVQALAAETKRMNDHILKVGVTNPVGVLEPSTNDVPPPATIPSNVSSESEITKFYTDNLSGVLSAEQLAKVQVTVEEDRVLVKTPYMPTGWQAVADTLKGLGGTFVSAGRDSHWVMPHP